MYVYFFGSESENSQLAEYYQLIISYLTKSGFKVISKIPSDDAVDLRPEQMADSKKSQESFLAKMKGIVLEVTEPDPEIGYLLAYAMMQKKPALCLYQKGKNIKSVLSYLGTKPPRNLITRAYNENNLEKIIVDFAKRLETSPEESDIPSIKFTLRISPRISSYLAFKTHKKNISKADWLREKIRKMITEDEEYKKFRQKNKIN